MTYKNLQKGTVMLLLCTQHYAVAEQRLTSDLLEDFFRFTEDVIEDQQVPGAVVAIVQPTTTTIKTYGVKRKGEDEPVDANTVFRIASLSKGFTGILAAMLAKQGYFHLNDPIAQYLPHVTICDKTLTEHIRIQDILSHNNGVLHYSLEHEAYHKKPFSQLIKNLNLAKPGKGFQYQNVIFSLISLIVEKTTHTPFHEILQKKILTPLGMKDTFLTEEAYNNCDNVAFPHCRSASSKEYFPLKSDSYYYNILPAGGIASSIADMCRWLQAVIEGYPEVFTLEDLMPVFTPYTYVPPTKRSPKMTKKSACKNTDCFCTKINTEHYGLGWRIQKYSGDTVIYHAGRLDGFGSIIAFSPKYKTGLVVLINSCTPLPAWIQWKFCDLLFGLPSTDWNTQKKNLLQTKHFAKFFRKLTEETTDNP